jgi:endo-1,4-beta-xylanase
VPLGTAVDWNQVKSSPRYAQFFLDHYQWMTPENELKMDALEPSQGGFSFGTADAMVNWALRHGKHVHGHVLIWGRQLPNWLSSMGTVGGATALRVMRTYIQTVLRHFRGRVDEWDVVNEAIAPNGSWTRNLWYKALGPAYVVYAFRFARAADPHARLCYNDDGIEVPGPHAATVLKIVKALRASRLIDCVGFESHIVAPGPSEQAVASELRRFAATGINILISELDVRLPRGVSLTKQAHAYASIATACRVAGTCTRLTTWGFTDASSWLGSSAKALPFNSVCKPKPAWRELQKALAVRR